MIKALARMFARLARSDVELHSSEKCSECGSQLARDTEGAGPERESWHCPNPDCPSQVRASLEFWCSAEVMGIAGSTPEFVAQLVKRGLVRDVAELYTLKHAEVDALDGMNEAKTDAFFAAMTASKQCEAWRVLLGLRIPRVTAEVAQSLCRHFRTLDDLFAAGAKHLIAAAGVDEAAAQNIIRWHSDSLNRKLVDRLRKADVNFKC